MNLFAWLFVAGDYTAFCHSVYTLQYWNSPLYLQNPSEVITGMAQGSKSLLSNTVYALSSATTQFSKAAHKVKKYPFTSTINSSILPLIENSEDNNK